MKLSEAMKEKMLLSFEVFPPKTEKGMENLPGTIEHLMKYKPEYISCTYGAGGGKNGDKTIQIASDIKNKYGIESIAHMPCINLSETDAIEILDKLKNNGIENILALRGDISPDTKPNGRFKHANDLISFIRERYDFNIISACYPECHAESKNIIEDIFYLKQKVDCGASHLITQLFLDNDDFYSFRERTELAGINVPIEAGIMPVTNKAQIQRMVKLCGIKLPKKFIRMIERYGDNPESLRDAGIAYAIDQIVDLISHDVDGIHLYTMNNPYVAKRIYEAVYRLISVHC